MSTLKVLSEDKGETTLVHLSGALDEDAGLDNIKIARKKNIVIDVSGIETINSCGGREWVKWIRSVAGTLKFVNCSSVFVDYANTIDGFIPKNGMIASFQMPYYCEVCDHVTLRVFQVRDLKDQKNQIAETTKCDNCEKVAEVDVIVPTFLKFLKGP